MWGWELLLACVVAIGAVFAGGNSYGAVSQDDARPLVRRARPDAITSAARIRLDVKEILIPVTVTDALDHPILNLTQDDFRLFEDDVEQKIISFTQEAAPASVGIVFDASGSMRTRLDKSLRAIDQFFKTCLQGDEFFLVKFSDFPKLLTHFTADPEEISRLLSLVPAQGWTALNDAIYLAAHEMRSAKNPRRALLVLTDGGDNNSRYSESEVRHLVVESDVRVYAIGMFERPRFLERLAEETGGKAVCVRGLNELPGAIETLSAELRNQYLLGYSSQILRKDGKYRKVRVQVAQRSPAGQLRVLWRKGYYSPAE
jgi:VWFA-related protein